MKNQIKFCLIIACLINATGCTVRLDDQQINPQNIFIADGGADNINAGSELPGYIPITDDNEIGVSGNDAGNITGDALVNQDGGEQLEFDSEVMPVDSSFPDVLIVPIEDAEISVPDTAIIPKEDLGLLPVGDAGNPMVDSGQIPQTDSENPEIPDIGTPIEEVGTPAEDSGPPLPIQCVLNLDCPIMQYCDEALHVCVWNPDVIKCRFVCPTDEYDYAAVYAAGERENIECLNGTFERRKNSICSNGHPEFRFTVCDRFGGGPSDEICEHGELAVVLCNNPNYSIEPDLDNAQAGMQIVVFGDDC